MEKIKIGKNEYNIGPLNAYDLDIVNESYEGKKLTKTKVSFMIYLYTIKLYNPDIKMEIDEFMKSCPVADLTRVCERLNEVTGINFLTAKKKS